MNRQVRRFSTGSLPEFVERLGGEQRQGDRGVFGIAPPLPSDIPVGPPTGGLRHVYSVFESRPIGAYDFEVPVVLHLESDLTSDDAYFSAQAGPFDGYTVFLRRITVCYQKPVAYPQSLSGQLRTGHRIKVSINKITVPNVEARSLAASAEYHLNTALWAEPTDTIEADVSVMSPMVFPRGLAIVTFAGTLIPYTGEPASRMAGSNESGFVERFAQTVAAFLRGGGR